MEEERFCSGWCRQLDEARRVLFSCTLVNGRWEIIDADCFYPDCPFAADCPVAAQARAPE